MDLGIHVCTQVHCSSQSEDKQLHFKMYVVSCQQCVPHTPRICVVCSFESPVNCDVMALDFHVCTLVHSS